jgi:hypothetical protein
METIRSARPHRLYVAADGPRERFGERARCEEARLIASTVDWPCEVHTLFREHNLGCGIAVSTAINWFFERETEGIILEDDCVPCPSFFRYCDELLERFRYDERIMCISGDNFQQGRSVTSYSYYFSRYMHCWGWASWRRAWRLYDFNMNFWADYRQLRGLESWSDGDPTFVNYWTEIFDRVARGEIDTWDYQWLFTCWAQHALACLPVRNLVTNIGFGHSDATQGPRVSALSPANRSPSHRGRSRNAPYFGCATDLRFSEAIQFDYASFAHCKVTTKTTDAVEESIRAVCAV